MNPAKIRLSPDEMELVTNAGWILTKNTVLQKTKHLLELICEDQQQILAQFADNLPQEILTIPPKISKGENYRGLPYLVLDYPRYFEKENVFAVRTMFWWGNFFSTTLQLSGRFKESCEQKIVDGFDLLLQREIYLAVGDDQWQHHFDSNNYRQIKQMDRQEYTSVVTSQPFIKLAQKIPLQQWDETRQMLGGHFSWLMQLVTGQLPSL